MMTVKTFILILSNWKPWELVLFIELDNRGNRFLIVNRGSLFQFEIAEIFILFFRIENRVNKYVF